MEGKSNWICLFVWEPTRSYLAFQARSEYFLQPNPWHPVAAGITIILDDSTLRESQRWCRCQCRALSHRHKWATSGRWRGPALWGRWQASTDATEVWRHPADNEGMELDMEFEQNEGNFRENFSDLTEIQFNNFRDASVFMQGSGIWHTHSRYGEQHQVIITTPYTCINIPQCS